MHVKCFKLVVLLLLALALVGCAAKKIPHKLSADYNKRGIRLIAIMPVVNKTTDEKAATILRARILEALYYKGYPKIPLVVIDEQLAKGDQNLMQDIKGIGETLGVNAVMMITLEECTRSVTFLSAKTAMTASFEMKSVKTGEVLWSVRHSAGERNFDVTRKKVEMKSAHVYEPIIQEIVDKVMNTLPEGPDV